MTAKRFKLAYADYDWWAICDKENPTELGISGEDVVELLNELHEENKTFREALQELKEIDDYQEMRINELHEENQRLQEENKELEKFKHFIFKSLNHIYEDKE